MLPIVLTEQQELMRQAVFEKHMQSEQGDVMPGTGPDPEPVPEESENRTSVPAKSVKERLRRRS